MGSVRKIIHVDMDAFYASVEQRDDPALRGRPVVVSGSPEHRGVVLTASYEARRFGVHSAMSARAAQRLCPQAVFLPPRFAAYKEASRQVRAIFHRYTDLVEPLSLDEAYLDVTEDKLGVGSALQIARAIRRDIFSETALTASAGVSIGKFLAKVASGMKKPNGLTFIGPSRVVAFMETLQVGDFYGVGKVTAQKMNRMGLRTGADLKKLSEDELVRHFGKLGHFYYRIVRGIDERPVEPHRETKSVSVEETFAEDALDLAELGAALDTLADELQRRLERYGLHGRTVTLKVKYYDFRIVTRRKTLPEPVLPYDVLRRTARELLRATDAGQTKIRLLGLGVSGFDEPAAPAGPSRQLGLFDEGS